MQRIMLATDFSERSDLALRRAVLLAREAAAGLEIVHVVDDDQPRRIVDSETVDARKLLDEIEGSLEAEQKLSCSTRVVQADPFAGILQAVEEAGPDLLVIGAHRRQILRDAFVGTTAERTIRSAACPVLMVNRDPVGPYRSVLLTTDLSDSSRTALTRFARLAIGAEAVLAAVHVIDAPALRLAMSGVLQKEAKDRHLGGLYAEAHRNLSDFLNRSQDAAPIVRHKETTVANAILAVADEAKSDLIMASTHCRGSLVLKILGSVTEQILRASPVDVLAIPPGQGAPLRR